MEERNYAVKMPTSVEVEYDRQNDILYIYFGEEGADEEVLSEDGNVALGFKDGRLSFIMIMKFSEKIDSYIL
ncbi:MAG: DUF2283 domain-containing protein [Desulfurococcaceae archaeon]